MDTVKSWSALAGIVLVAVGLIGFLGTPLVGSASGALVPTDGLHNVVHLARMLREHPIPPEGNTVPMKHIG